MSVLTRITCLAFSTREGGYCLAGLDGGVRWVRPVSGAGHGEIRNPPLTPSVLDVVEVPLDHPCPEPHQPENWLLGNGGWAKRGRLTAAQAGPLLSNLLEPGPGILGSTGDCIPSATVQQRPLQRSLAVVRPGELTFCTQWGTGRGQRQARCTFTLANEKYDLSLTDCAWQRHVRKSMRVGDAPRSVAELLRGQLQPSNGSVSPGDIERLVARAEVFLTVSLTGEFHRYHYKLVAGVIVLLPSGTGGGPDIEPSPLAH